MYYLGHKRTPLIPLKILCLWLLPLVVASCEHAKEDLFVGNFYDRKVILDDLQLDRNIGNIKHDSLIVMRCSKLLWDRAVEYYSKKFKIVHKNDETDAWVDYYLQSLDIRRQQLRKAREIELEILDIMETALTDEKAAKEKFFSKKHISGSTKWEYIQLRLKDYSIDEIQKYKSRLLSEKPERVFWGTEAKYALAVRKIVSMIKGKDYLCP